LGKGESKKKDFHNHALKALKSVAGSLPTGEPASGMKTAGPSHSKEPAAKELIGDTELFAREMAMLGVDEQPKDDEQPEKESLDDHQEIPVAPPPKAIAVTEQEEFLSALGQMEALFQDEFPGEESPVATPGRMKQLRQGRLAPEASLDLHGMTREQARGKIRFFLEDSVFQGRKTVLVITGRGKGSPDGPVLRTDIQRYLAGEAKAWVVEWGQAPARYGGEGALVVFLKTLKRHQK